MTAEDPIAEWIASTQAFQAEALAQLEASADSASEADGCAAWLNLERHADRLVRNLDATSRSAKDSHRELMAVQRRALEGFRARASARAAAFAGAQRRKAQRSANLRLAIIGKGGSGKSVIGGTLSRLLARGGRRVLLADLDTTPGVSFSVGLGPSDAGLPPEALDGDGGWMTRLRPGIGPLAAVDRFAAVAPDGVRYLGIGKFTGDGNVVLQRSFGPVLQVLTNFAPPGWDVIADFEAGPRGAFNNLHLFADLVVVVVSPMWKSARAAQRLRGVVTTRPIVVVANRWRDQPDFEGLEPVVRIPDDPAIAEADRLGVAPIDHAPGSPAVAAISELATALRGGVWR